jgi:hypothetical protein
MKSETTTKKSTAIDHYYVHQRTVAFEEENFYLQILPTYYVIIACGGQFPTNQEPAGVSHAEQQSAIDR